MRAKVRDTELYFDVDGMGLVPEAAAMRERPVLFLLHGGPGGEHSSFKTQMAGLRNVVQLVFLDHRGSGRSQRGEASTWTLENNIEDLEALRRYLGLERISVLGSSYGGIVAQGYAVRYPDRVSNLVLVATAPSFRFIDKARRALEERGTPEQIRVCRWLWEGSFESDEQLKEYYWAMGPRYSIRFDPEKFESSWARGIRNFEQLNLGFSGFLRTFDFVDELQKISCPTLVLAGTHDWICPPAQAKVIAERIPRAHLKIFQHSAHSIAVDEPAAFQAAVTGFLTCAAS